MNLFQALKLKNRLAGEIARYKAILERENSRRNDSTSTVNREEVWNKIIQISEQLVDIKSKIATANVNIYPFIEKMNELKGRIAFLQSLNKREGNDTHFVGQYKMEYSYSSYINDEKADKTISEIQLEIDRLQDVIDQYNATTQVD